MSDYISREELTNNLDALCDRVCQYSKKQRSVMCGACPLGDAFDMVEEIPAADVRPAVRGRWQKEHLASTSGGTYSVVRCSVCRAQFPMYETSYCPNCGADMQGEE